MIEICLKNTCKFSKVLKISFNLVKVQQCFHWLVFEQKLSILYDKNNFKGFKK